MKNKLILFVMVMVLSLSAIVVIFRDPLVEAKKNFIDQDVIKAVDKSEISQKSICAKCHP